MKAAAIRFIGRLWVGLFIGVGALSVLLLLMVLRIFEGPAYEDDLVGGYVVHSVDAKDYAALYRVNGDLVIPPMVYAYGWNDDFIVVKRYAPSDGRTTDFYMTEWYLIEVRKAQEHGPLTEQQFTELRRELGVPKELAFTKTIWPG